MSQSPERKRPFITFISQLSISLVVVSLIGLSLLQFEVIEFKRNEPTLASTDTLVQLLAAETDRRLEVESQALKLFHQNMQMRVKYETTIHNLRIELKRKSSHKSVERSTTVPFTRETVVRTPNLRGPKLLPTDADDGT